jgi:hypothetical protein
MFKKFSEKFWHFYIFSLRLEFCTHVVSEDIFQLHFQLEEGFHSLFHVRSKN